MNFGDKLVQQRKKMGISQEQLAEKIGVTRQSVSKWELSSSVPELGKLIQLSELFGVSIDYLVKDYIETEPASNQEDNIKHQEILEGIEALSKQIEVTKTNSYHYTSKKKIFNIPLIDIRFSSNMAGMNKDNTAKGIIAIGNNAVGVISIGLVSIGIFSLGLLALGIIAIAITAIGLLSLGVVALGVYAAGFCVVAKELGIGYVVAAKMAVGKEVDGLYTLVLEEGMDVEEIITFIKMQYAFIPQWLIKLLCRI